MITLNNHSVWQNLSAVVSGLDANSLVLEHLELNLEFIDENWQIDLNSELITVQS
ncbi:hypothetical protein [Coleofasciculus sp. E1-EBD-02]|uniref:hypothetical protein n=1 Tax=Coleofasciculus sp. E1-EBD-02 TaxID=3068481 RepID=UPI0033018D3D